MTLSSRSTLYLGFSFIVLLSSNASAGPYIGASIGSSAADEVCDEESEGAPYGVPECEGNTYAQKLFAGLTINQYSALEAAYLDMGELAKTINAARVTAETKGTNISLVGIYPFGGTMNAKVFGKLGWLLWNTTVVDYSPGGGTVDDSGSDISFGIGASVGGEHISFRVEYEILNEVNVQYSPDGSTLSFASIGMVYEF